MRTSCESRVLSTEAQSLLGTPLASYVVVQISCPPSSVHEVAVLKTQAGDHRNRAVGMGALATQVSCLG